MNTNTHNEKFGDFHFDPAKDDEKTLTGAEVGEEPQRVETVHPGQTVRRQSRYKNSVSRWKATTMKPEGYDRRKSSVWGEKDDHGDEKGEDIDYATLSWWQAGFIMIAETVSLGILSLPDTLATVGLVPGVILILVLGVIATYTGWVIGKFRLKYPHVASFGDAGEILGEPIKCGRIFSELFGWAQTFFQIFTMASHILTFTICLNTISDSKVCTMVWGVIALGIFFVLDLPRTLDKVAIMSIFSFASILSAVFITMIDVGVTKPIGNGALSATKQLGFTRAFLSVSNIIFAYAGHSCFFGFLAEMKKPEDWPKALAVLQACDITLYLVVALVVYRYTGENVKSPALGSARGVVKKVAWGIALPTIIIAGVIYGHIAAKYIFLRIFRGTKHVAKKTFVSRIAWPVIVLVIWVIAWIIAESIPNFNDLLGVISSLFATAFTYYLSGAFGLFLDYDGGIKAWFRDWKQSLLTIANIVSIIVGVASCILGMWSASEAISKDAGGASWTCKSNAQ